MHLYREVLASINKLDKQRKLVAKALIVVFAHQLALQFFYQFVQLLASIGAIGYDGFVVFNT